MDTTSSKVQHPNDIIFEDYLNKISRYLRQSRKRWVVLKDRKLYCYKKKQIYSNPTEVFDLTVYEQVILIEDTMFAIQSTTPDQLRLFVTNNINETNTWIDLIKTIHSLNCAQHPASSNIIKVTDIMTNFEQYDEKYGCDEIVTTNSQDIATNAPKSFTDHAETECIFVPELKYDTTMIDSAELQESSKHFIYPSNPILDSRDFKCKLSYCFCLRRLAAVLKSYNCYLTLQHILNLCIDEFAESNDTQVTQQNISYESDKLGPMNKFEQLGVNERNSIYDVFNEITYNYNNVSLLNHFNHLLFCHANQFEEMYNIFSKIIYNNESCSLSKCLLMKRNQRNRSKMAKNEYLLNMLYLNDEDVVSQQLLDRIHCYFFHSFDTGYKLTEKQRNHIINQDRKVNDETINANDYDIYASQINSIVKSKQNYRRNIRGLNRLNNPNNKFAAFEKQYYSYGFRFYYWIGSEYHHVQWNRCVNGGLGGEIIGTDINGNWYVCNKYKNLQQELTNNTTYVICKTQMNNLVQKAQIHIQTDNVREMYCPRIDSAKYYEMYPRQLISIQHLIAMMVYCNYDELQKNFSETFRKVTKNETDKSLKERHSKYYFMARLLRECAECFGMKYHGTIGENITLFHGVNNQFSFLSMNANIKGPFSTSTDYMVAVNFCNNQGMILEMSIPVQWWFISGLESTNRMGRLQCMDMQWISDFINEQEIFCIGGLRRLQYETIIDCRTGSNYSAYIGGIKVLTQSTDTEQCDVGHISDFVASSFDNQMTFRLLSHELHRHMQDHPCARKFKGCPEYIENIVHMHCKNVIGVTMGTSNIVMNYLLIDNKTKWMKLDLMTCLFPRVQIITYHAHNRNMQWLTQSSMYDSVLDFIATNKHSLIRKISVVYDGKAIFHKHISTFVEKYKESVTKYGWSITANIKNSAPLGLDCNRWKNMFSSHDDTFWDKLLQSDEIKPMFAKFGVKESCFKKLIQNPDKLQSYFQTASIEMRKK
eukprot:542625_1